LGLKEPMVKSIPNNIGEACKPLRRLQDKLEKLHPHSEEYVVFLLEFYRLEKKIRKVWNYKECIHGPKGPCKDNVILPCDYCDEGRDHSKSQENKLSN